MRETVVESLKERMAKRVVLCDGGMGTMLQSKGLPAGECGDHWNVTHPDVVTGIHKGYLEAGSDCILTNTFGATRPRLAEYGLEDEVDSINEAACKLAVDAAREHDALVLGDIGPSGRVLIRLGDKEQQGLDAAFRQQTGALVRGGVDALIIETMTSVAEMIVAVRAVKEVTDLPLIACYSFDRGPQGYRTMMGQDIAECMKALEDGGVDVVGTNCALGIDDVVEVVREIHSVCSLPIIAMPNAGLPEIENGQIVYKQKPHEMAEKTPDLIMAGARIVGGCCGTTPEFIRMMKDYIDFEK